MSVFLSLVLSFFFSFRILSTLVPIFLILIQLAFPIPSLTIFLISKLVSFGPSSKNATSPFPSASKIPLLSGAPILSTRTTSYRVGIIP